MKYFKIKYLLMPLFCALFLNVYAQYNYNGIPIPNEDGLTIYYYANHEECKFIVGGSYTIPESMSDIGLRIPGTIKYNGKTYTVYEINNKAFQDRTDIKRVVLPNTISLIGQYAFHGCTNLDEINLPEELDSIALDAFAATGLKEITIKGKFSVIPNYCFANCKQLAHVTIGENVKIIGPHAFASCPKLEEITIPDNVQVIQSDAFHSATFSSSPSEPKCGLKKVILGKGLTRIDVGAFKCNQLDTVISYIVKPFNSHTVNWKNEHSPIFFYDLPTTLLVPEGTQSLYKSTPDWNLFKDIREMNYLSRINLDISEKKLFTGDTYNIMLTMTPSNAYFNEITWESSNDAVASVSQDGFVTANGYGVATIKVSSFLKPEVNATCVVSVFEHTTGIKLSYTSLVIDLGTNKKMTAFTLPFEKSDNEIIWTSSDEDIATVDNNGKVSALKIGECEITATSVDGGFSASCKVNVIQRACKVEVDKREASMQIGQTTTLRATVSPDNTTDKTVLWTSRNTAIAEVDGSGVVTGKKAGKVYIVATAASNPEAKDSCEVTVLQPVTGITMSQEELTFTEIGQTKQLKATVSPDDASNKAVRWRSFNENVCSVSESGYVVAVGYGSAVITATSVDGGFVGTCICKVIEKAPDPIMGDVDNNREVNVLDIVKTVDYIMKRPIDNFYVSLADFDGDEKITVADLVEIVSIVSSQSQINGMVAASNIGSGKVCMTTNDDGTLSLGVKDSRMYIATQMVVELSDNQRLVDVSSIDGHNVVFRNIGGNRYSVISYSNQNNVYESSDRMINLAITGDGFVNVESVLAVDVDRRSVVFENNDVEYVTGIAEITVDFNQPTDIYTVGGVLIKRNATSTEGLSKGMYIINNKKYYKK